MNQQNKELKPKDLDEVKQMKIESHGGWEVIELGNMFTIQV